jgi:hypothetical protein
VLLLIAVLAFFFLRRRRRQKREQPPPPDLTSSGPAELETDKSVPQEAKGLGPGSGWEAGKPELEGGIMNPPMAELSSPPPLSPEEYAELERRRRAVELQGQSMGQVRAAELQGQAHPRAELEALRANARVVHELGGQDILHEFHPVYQR